MNPLEARRSRATVDENHVEPSFQRRRDVVGELLVQPVEDRPLAPEPVPELRDHEVLNQSRLGVKGHQGRRAERRFRRRLHRPRCGLRLGHIGRCERPSNPLQPERGRTAKRGSIAAQATPAPEIAGSRFCGPEPVVARVPEHLEELRLVTSHGRITPERLQKRRLRVAQGLDPDETVHRCPLEGLSNRVVQRTGKAPIAFDRMELEARPAAILQGGAEQRDRAVARSPFQVPARAARGHGVFDRAPAVGTHQRSPVELHSSNDRFRSLVTGSGRSPMSRRQLDERVRKLAASHSEERIEPEFSVSLRSQPE